jgi:hypothetical protein
VHISLCLPLLLALPRYFFFDLPLMLKPSN